MLGNAAGSLKVMHIGTYRGWNFDLKANSERNPYTGSRVRPSRSSTLSIIAEKVVASGSFAFLSESPAIVANGAPDRLRNSTSSSSSNFSAAEAMRNSIAGRNPSERRLMKSSVHPTELAVAVHR